MIKTEVLESIISSALFSAYIAEEKPLSLLVTAKVESGKTAIAVKFKDNSKIKYLTDATAFSIWRDLSDQIEKGEIKHFVFPDLLTPFSRSRDTVDSFIMFLTNLIEEGIAEVHSGFLQEGGIILEAPTSIGIIGCVASGDLTQTRYGWWTRVGFMSRLLPVSYTYSSSTVDEIKDSIARRVYVTDSPITLKFPLKQIEMELPTRISRDIRKLEEKITLDIQRGQDSLKGNSANPGVKPYGFRMLKHLQKLIMGYTLSQGRDEVTDGDYRILKYDFLPFLNLDFKEI